MASLERPPSFQFYARDFLSSRSVREMSPAARGAYITLLCVAWLEDEPGTLPNDDVRLARLSETYELWPTIREEVLRAFVVQNDKLVQRRMMTSRQEQRQRYEQARKGASITNARRWGSVAVRQKSESLSGRSSVTPASASASASAVESSLPPPSPANDATRAARSARGWTASFEAFWALYPRKVKKLDAQKAWSKIKPEIRPTIDAVLDAVRRARESHDWTKDNGEFVPYPATWIRAGGWMDERPANSSLQLNTETDPLAEARARLREIEARDA